MPSEYKQTQVFPSHVKKLIFEKLQFLVYPIKLDLQYLKMKLLHSLHRHLLFNSQVTKILILPLSWLCNIL